MWWAPGAGAVELELGSVASPAVVPALVAAPATVLVGEAVLLVGEAVLLVGEAVLLLGKVGAAALAKIVVRGLMPRVLVVVGALASVLGLGLLAVAALVGHALLPVCPGLQAPLEVVVAEAVAVARLLAGALVGVVLSGPALLRLVLASVPRLTG